MELVRTLEIKDHKNSKNRPRPGTIGKNRHIVKSSLAKTLFPILVITGCSTQGPDLLQEHKTDAETPIANIDGGSDAPKDTSNIPETSISDSNTETYDATETSNDSSPWDAPLLNDANDCTLYEAGTHNSPTTITFSSNPEGDCTHTSVISAYFSPSEGFNKSNSWASDNASFEISSDQNDLYPLVFTASGLNAITIDLNTGNSTIFEVNKPELAETLQQINCDPGDANCEEIQLMLETPDYTYAPFALNIWSLKHTANLARCAFNLPNGLNCHIYESTDAETLENIFTQVAMSGTYSESFPNETRIYMGINGCPDNN